MGRGRFMGRRREGNGKEEEGAGGEEWGRFISDLAKT